jgi:hypothetical protein
MTSSMPVATIFGAADVNGVLGYYHCSNMPKCARGYNDLPSVTPRVSKPHDYANHMFRRL